MEQGYIKLWRKLLNDPIMEQPKLLCLWITLLLMANHKPNKIIWNKQEMTIERGQVLTGRKALKKKTRISERSIRTCLTTLKLTNKVTIKAYPKFSIITILNYDTYQSSDQHNDQQVTSKRPASDQQVTTNNNDKNDKNEENDKKGEGRPFDFLLKTWKGQNRELDQAYPKYAGMVLAEISAAAARGITPAKIEARLWEVAGKGVKPWELFPQQKQDSQPSPVYPKYKPDRSAEKTPMPADLKSMLGQIGKPIPS